MYIPYMASGCALEEASFVLLDDLDNISISLHEENDLGEQITHLFSEVSISIFKFKKTAKAISLYIYLKHVL